MYRSTENMTAEASGIESKDVPSAVGLESVLEELSNGRLAQRIVKAARVAAARHKVQEAQEVRSAVETEISAP